MNAIKLQLAATALAATAALAAPAGAEPGAGAPAGEPQRWLMLVAGLALAGWVAHRRLAHPL